VPVEFIDQLEEDAGAETVKLLDVTLPTKPLLRLRVTGVLD